jgi:hypothetical protein
VGTLNGESVFPKVSEFYLLKMEVAGIPILTFVAFILTIVAFVVDLIGFAAPYWFYFELAGNTHYGGIWKICK